MFFSQFTLFSHLSLPHTMPKVSPFKFPFYIIKFICVSLHLNYAFFVYILPLNYVNNIELLHIYNSLVHQAYPVLIWYGYVDYRYITYSSGETMGFMIRLK